MYQNWSYRIIDVESPDHSEYEQSEPAEKVAQDLCVQLLNLGAFFAKNAKVSRITDIPSVLPF